MVAIDRVRYVGDIIAAVAAEEKDVAEEALELIEVQYEQLPAVFDLHACDETRCAGHSCRSSQSAVLSGKERISPGNRRQRVEHVSRRMKVISPLVSRKQRKSSKICTPPKRSSMDISSPMPHWRIGSRPASS